MNSAIKAITLNEKTCSSLQTVASLINPPSLSAEIDFIDIAPRRIDVQISLTEYFERVKRYKADRWQRDLCDRLQQAAVDRHIERYWSLFHAEGQLGKTTIFSQCFPAWLIGHDPLFRFALAMYNAKQSAKHSKVVIQILNSNIHRDIFPSKDGYIVGGDNAAATGWMTGARAEAGDGQLSFNPVGLISGLTGSGFDWLLIDDPYRSQKDAFSETINEGMRDFYNYTVLSRTGLHSCITGMFHRYAPEDFAGYLLDTGDFDYVRYATQADGDYIHDNTGRRYPDPLNREKGEYISPERRPPHYYDKVKKNNRVWLSMFQGRPSAEEGEFFNVGKIRVISREEAEQRRRECVAFVRAYDLAATEADGDYTVGALGGIRPDGKITVFEIVRKQLDTAGRDELQKRTAKRDGINVVVTVPQDPGAGGKSVVFHTEQMLKDYTVVARATTGSKEDRARNAAGAVNSGDYEFVDDADLPDEDSTEDLTRWIRPAKREMRDFPLSEYKDIVDAIADMHNELTERLIKGLVVANYKPLRNLVTYAAFARRFPFRSPDGRLLLKIPQKFNIYCGVKISADRSLPTCGIITAQASENSGLGDKVFAVAEYLATDGSVDNLVAWLRNAFAAYCELVDESNTTIWLAPESESYASTLQEKLNVSVAVFDRDAEEGIPEMNWYLAASTAEHEFNAQERAAHLYFLIDESQFSVADERRVTGFYHARRELATWGYDEKGEPNKTAAILDCLRMCLAGYALSAVPLTEAERYERRFRERLAERLKEKSLKDIHELAGDPEIDPSVTVQMTHKLLKKEMREAGEFVRETPFDEPVPDYEDIAGGW